MSKEFLLNLILLLSINLLVKPLYAFGVDLQVQQSLGDSYGLYFALWNFSCLFQMLGDMGLQQYNSQAIAANTDFFRANFARLLGVKFFFLGLMLFVALGVGWFSGYSGQAFELLLLLLANQIFISLTFFFRSSLAGLGRYRIDSILSALDKILMLIFGFWLLGMYPKGSLRVEYFVYSQSLAYILAMLAAGALVFLSRQKAAKTAIFVASWTEIVGKSLPFAVAVLLMMFYNRADAVFLERWLPATEGQAAASDYAFAYRFFDLGNMVAFLFSGLLFPMFARLTGQKEATRELLTIAGGLVLIFSLGYSSAIYLYALPLQELLAPQRQPTATLSLLIWALNAAAVIQVWGTLLTAQARLWRLNALFLAAIILNLLLNISLIPQYGAWAAAFSALITQSFVATVQLFWVARWLEIGKISFKISLDFWRWPLFLLGLALGIWAWSQQSIIANWQISALVFGILYTIWTLIAGVFKPKTLWLIFKKT
jgi:O-antigen/teichoic acid export membrane protein